MAKMDVQGKEITVITREEDDYISLTDMLKAKDGDFFVSDWLRNRDTVVFLGIWERIYNPNFNYGEFAIIKSQAGLNSYKISIKIAIQQMKLLTDDSGIKKLKDGVTANKRQYTRIKKHYRPFACISG